MSELITVLIVDDHPIVRQGLAALVEDENGIQVVGQVGSVQAAVDACRSQQPHVVLLDLRLGAESGVAVIKAIAPTHPHIRFVVFTTFDEDDDIFVALEAGAKGYLLKDTFCDEILSTVRAVHAGGERIPKPLKERLKQRRAESALSARELQVLNLVARGLSNKEVAGTLTISEGTVKTHMVHILEKLHVDDRTAAATVAIRRGLVRPG